ncbi:MAG: hypothetical protein HFJ52_04205 [Clostridia bacterium]|nr:hypothetical protein [Clostridia bacterium]
MEETLKELFEKVAGLCYEISTRTKADAFFDYYPHCNVFNVRYYENGWSDRVNAEYIALHQEIHRNSLNDVIEKLKIALEESK